jgi:CPA2 family monovalent cation:H+ antiporter-2
MHHDTPLISTIVAALVLAYIFGMIANRLRMPPLVGYLLAGVLVGPHTPGFVADQALGAELSELGVILLMFGVGLHFSLKDLMSVRSLAIPGAIAQIAVATLLGLGLALLMGWGLGAGIIFGLALSVASTVVLLKALQDRRLIETERGRIAVGWLIVEDIAMVLALVLIPAFASLNGGEALIHDPFVSFVERIVGGSIGIWGVLALTLVKLAAFVGFMLVVGRRAIPWALHLTAHTGSRELFRLAVLAIALGVALGSSVLFGVSLALGAFFAGMILSESELSHRAAQETLPLRDAFAVLFFVSVGMLFNPSILITNPLPVLATVFIIIIGKSLAAFGIVLLFKRPVGTALTISASLAQIGEFSFILASLGVSLAILPPEGQDLILAGALISIVLNPVVFWAIDLARPRVEARAAQFRAARMERDGVPRIEPREISAAANGPLTTDAPSAAGVDIGAPGADDDVPEPSQQTGHTVLVGYGRVGRVVGEGLHAARSPLVVIEDSDHSVAAARAAGIEVVVGNAASAQVLQLANLGAARCLMVAIPNGYEAGSVCEAGRKLSPSIRIIARAHSEEEETHLRNFGANDVIMGEREIGLGMLAWLRGERGDNSPAAASDKSRLPPTGNLLQTAAAPIVADLVLEEPAAADRYVAAEPVSEPIPEEPTIAPEAPELTADEVLAADIPGVDSLEPDDFEPDLDQIAPIMNAEEEQQQASSLDVIEVREDDYNKVDIATEPAESVETPQLAEEPTAAVPHIVAGPPMSELEAVHPAQAGALLPVDEPIEEHEPVPPSEKVEAPAEPPIAIEEIAVSVMPQMAPSQLIVDQRAIMAAHIILPSGTEVGFHDQTGGEQVSAEQPLAETENAHSTQVPPVDENEDLEETRDKSQGVVPSVVPEPKV